MLNEVFLCAGLRSPIGRYAGKLSTVRPDDLAAQTIAAVLAHAPDLEPDAVDEVVLGCANQAGEDNRNVARMATLLAGLPATVPALTVNRLCASGLDAILYSARAIQCGDSQVMIAGGVESMSRAPFVMPKATSAFTRSNAVYDTTIGWRFVNRQLAQQYGIDSMPETAENVAEAFNISRQDQDQFAVNSQYKARQAIARGRLAEEIHAITIPGDHSERCAQDEHPRETTLEKLAQLATPFRLGGSITAGNAAGVNDGSCALLLASAEAVKRYNLTPYARILGGASAGVAPRIMGIGPVPAIHKLLARLGLALSDFGHIEVNEAFAAQVLACLRQLSIADDDPRVNPNGGAIALGHPLGMSGARLALTAAIEMGNTKHNQYALCAMCVGVGQGVALALAQP